MWTLQCDSAVERMLRPSPDLLPSAPSNLLTLLTGEAKVKHEMVYIGGSGTSTPLHVDLVGSVGVNVAVNFPGRAPDSHSVWVIFPSGQFTTLLRGFLRLKTGLDVEHGAIELSAEMVEEFVESAGVGSKPYIHRQSAGEVVVVPSAAAHSVINMGLTVKLAWSLMTVNSLQIAVASELRVHRR